jgi:hypothetical protein
MTPLASHTLLTTALVGALLPPTSQDAIDGFAALRNNDESGFRALLASGRVSMLPEGTTARVLDVASHGNTAFKVRVMSDGPGGQEAWVFYGICH